MVLSFYFYFYFYFIKGLNLCQSYRMRVYPIYLMDKYCYKKYQFKDVKKPESLEENVSNELKPFWQK